MKAFFELAITLVFCFPPATGYDCTWNSNLHNIPAQTRNYMQTHPSGHHRMHLSSFFSRYVFREAHDLGYRGYVGLETVPTDELIAAKRIAEADIR